MEDQPMTVLCLFCSQNFPNQEKTFVHCFEQHGFDMVALQRAHNLDCISYIKMINYIRNKKPEPEEVLKIKNQIPWESDDFMKPCLEDDPLLLFDIEHYTEQLEVQREHREETFDNELITIPKSEYLSLLQRLKTTEKTLENTKQKLSETLRAMQTMRDVAAGLLSSSSGQPVESSEAVANLKDDEDDAYFDSYGHFSIHQTMLQDTVRTECYRDAILNNKDTFHDKVVLDVGCGTGILSMFAATAGAKLVIGVDMSDVAYQAMDIIKENKLESKVKIIKGRMEDVDIPVEKVDIIISEWMGYFLLFESMLDSVLWARDHYLSSEGMLLPNTCSILLAGLDDQDMHRNNLSYWDNVYGFKMNCMKTAVVGEASVVVVDHNKIITDCCTVKNLDCHKCSTKDVEFSSNFQLTASKSGQITAIVGYFDIGFTALPSKVTFSTSPQVKPTHWKQTVFLLQESIQLASGDVVQGKITCTKHRKDPRSLKISISVAEMTQNYIM